jgi:hypothetical protein
VCEVDDCQLLSSPVISPKQYTPRRCPSIPLLQRSGSLGILGVMRNYVGQERVPKFIESNCAGSGMEGFRGDVAHEIGRMLY